MMFRRAFELTGALAGRDAVTLTIKGDLAVKIHGLPRRLGMRPAYAGNAMCHAELPELDGNRACLPRQSAASPGFDLIAWQATVKATVEDPARLAALGKTGLLDSPPEEEFDRFANLAARLAGAPAAAVVFIDKDRQFFKSAVGLAEPLLRARGTPLSHSFCQHVVSLRQPLVVGDARSHPLVSDNPILEQGVIAYIGVPLILPHGEVIGSLCAIDAKPRDWQAGDVGALSELAAMAMTEIALREDIAERKRAEREIALNERRYRSLVEATAAIVWDTPASSGRFEVEQPRWSAFTGQSYRELHGWGWLNAIHPDDRAATVDAWSDALANRSAYEVEHRLRASDGSYRNMIARAVPILAEDGTVHQWIGVHTDITEQKKSEARLLELNRELIDLSREAGMAEIATSVLHNVGNVLNSANISLEVAATKMRVLSTAGLGRIADLLREHAHDLPEFLGLHPQGRKLSAYLGDLAKHINGEQSAALGEIKALRHHFDHISEIVARQQRHAAGAGGITEILSVNEIVEDALRMDDASQDDKACRVVRELGPDIPPLPLDRHKIMLILVNLFRNARQALSEPHHSDPCLTIRTKLAGPARLSIAVADNGAGISEPNLPRIFEYGFTTKPSGHGFGLHSCAIAAQEMGGSLQVSSAGVGQGALFTLEIPAGTDAL